ncbi:hypothetical protein [Psychrobacter immobilis]|uniref:hypothetical protein n=1 Tax=Psychrobacter immobilis TaxID=498 RepID=UPI00191AB652|nr:hypothetical protein [Psychrobacter immobilis]
MCESLLSILISKIIHSKGELVFNKNLENINLDKDTYELVSDIVLEVSDRRFAKNYLDTTLRSGSSAFTLFNRKDAECSVFLSYMINRNTNVILAEAEGMEFILIQHVTSCDFVYFPSINYLHPVAHFNLQTASNVIKNLVDIPNIQTLYEIAVKSKSHFQGLILSHGRPYHFFYETSILTQELYQQGLLGAVPHYQLAGGDFIDFTKLYGLDVPNYVVDPKYLNNLSSSQQAIFFKVGAVYDRTDSEIVNLTRQFEKQVVSSIDILDESKIIYNKVWQLKHEDYFVLWFGVSTEKRSLKNQVELVHIMISELKSYHKICVVVDGWTAPNSNDSLNPVQARPDLEVFSKIKHSNPEIELISLIGANSSQKLAVSTIVDFHISSGATGSMWAARFGKKEGIFHNSQAFYHVQDVHIHRRGLDFPNQFVKDVVEKVQRVDYTSYSIDKDDFLAFIKASYPNIFKEKIHLKRLKVRNMHNIEMLNAIKNSLKSLTNDPQINIDINSLTIDDIKVPFTLHLTCYIDFASDNSKHLAKFYLNYGNGFNAKEVVEYFMENGKNYFEVDIEVSKPLKGIRFDPTDMKDVSFNFKGLFYSVSNINK